LFTNLSSHTIKRQKLLIFRTLNSTLCVLSPKSMSDQVVRVIVIQKTLIEHAEKLRQVKAVLEEVIFSQQRTFWNDTWRKFLRDIHEGSTEAAEVGW
ncbi:hypothetical protein IGI04_036736, partial [Brassica rapa subsp. trilocularis]